MADFYHQQPADNAQYQHHYRQSPSEPPGPESAQQQHLLGQPLYQPVEQDAHYHANQHELQQPPYQASSQPVHPSYPGFPSPYSVPPHLQAQQQPGYPLPAASADSSLYNQPAFPVQAVAPSDNLVSQMGEMALTDEPSLAAGTRRKKKDRHAYHSVGAPALAPAGPMAAFNPAFAPAFDQFPVPVNPPYTPPVPVTQAEFAARNGGSAVTLDRSAASPPYSAAVAVGASGQTMLSSDDLPSVPLWRDAVQPHYNTHIYPTFERLVPPPATVTFAALDQGNSSPKYARLTMNSLPATAEGLASTGLPLGLLLQPLAPQVPGEPKPPVLDFGSAGPPRCRRCRAYINPFMMFRSGGNRFVCNLCTHPNDTPSEYFCATTTQGVRADRDHRPELLHGTVEFIVPREYCTREPEGMRWLFLIDVTQESINKRFVDAFCRGILDALYGSEDVSSQDTVVGDGEKRMLRRLPEAARVGFVTFDRDIHFYNIKPGLEQAQMMIMPDLEDPFLPLAEGLFVDPYASKDIITSLLNRLPSMFSQIKHVEPAFLAALNSALAALENSGGKVVASLSALSSWGPGRLHLRDDGKHLAGELDKKLLSTELPGWKKVAEKMVLAGIGVDMFLAAPSGGYLDIATIGHVSSTSGGETFYYPNFIAERDGARLELEIERTVTRETGYQAVLKIRCSNGLQISAFHGNFVQHTSGADLEMGVTDADKAFALTFTYDGKLDSKLDVHFQSALLYTTASGQRRVRCCNVIARVSDSARECLRYVDQDAVLSILAKEAATKLLTTAASLREVRNFLTGRVIDVMACYRKNFLTQAMPSSQLVMPDRLKELCILILSLIKCRAFKGGSETSDRRVYEARMLRSMGASELSAFLYPRILAIHNLHLEEGFPDANTGHLCLPPAVRATYSSIELGGAYLLDNGQQCLLWLHHQTSPNLLQDLFGQGRTSLAELDAYNSALPVLPTHLSAQVRNLLAYLRAQRGSKGMAVQLARQGTDGAEHEFARSLIEDRNNEAQNYVDWLGHIHRVVMQELSGQRRNEDKPSGTDIGASLASFAGLRPLHW